MNNEQAIRTLHRTISNIESVITDQSNLFSKNPRKSAPLSSKRVKGEGNRFLSLIEINQQALLESSNVLGEGIQ